MGYNVNCLEGTLFFWELKIFFEDLHVEKGACATLGKVEGQGVEIMF